MSARAQEAPILVSCGQLREMTLPRQVDKLVKSREASMEEGLLHLCLLPRIVGAQRQRAR